MSVQSVQLPMIQTFDLSAGDRVQLRGLLQKTAIAEQTAQKLDSILLGCIRDGKSLQEAYQDPRTRRLLHLLQRRCRRHRGKRKGKKPTAKMLLRQLRYLERRLRRVHQFLKRVLRPHGPLPNAVRRRHGDETANQVNSILSSNRSLEEKFMLVCSLLADKMEKEIETQMKKWNEALSGDAKKKGGKGLFGALTQIAKIAGPILTVANPVAGAAISGVGALSSGMTSGKTDGKSQAKQIETKIQMMMQRLNRLMAMISNCMSANHKAKMASINNIRA